MLGGQLLKPLQYRRVALGQMSVHGGSEWGGVLAGAPRWTAAGELPQDQHSGGLMGEEHVGSVDRLLWHLLQARFAAQRLFSQQRLDGQQQGAQRDVGAPPRAVPRAEDAEADLAVSVELGVDAQVPRVRADDLDLWGLQRVLVGDLEPEMDHGAIVGCFLWSDHQRIDGRHVIAMWRNMDRRRDALRLQLRELPQQPPPPGARRHGAGARGACRAKGPGQRPKPPL
mmetsp:Transcript_49917/g.141413  ORF Transcript_49917/g.141413 Transcript_49917/m.141413 type:complete len:227 (-) Transcript_49917:18-698(-)